MKLRASVQAGLIAGFAGGLGLHWLSYRLLYERTYDFEFPAVANTPLTILAVLLAGLALGGLGPMVIAFAEGEVKTAGQGLAAGGLAGLVAGVIVFLAVGAVAAGLLFGVISLLPYLAYPERITPTGYVPMLQEAVRQTIGGTYRIMAVFLAAGAIVGGVEGAAAAWVRAALAKRRMSKVEDATTLSQP